jgi:phage FluMu gp28-like protein
MSTDASTFFLPYQARWIRDEAPLKLMEKSRQIGISWSTAYGAVRRAAVSGAKHDVWVSSRDDVQAKLFLEDCKAWAKVLQIAAKDLGAVIVGDDGKASASVLEFASGKRIYSLSSNPNALAGKRGHVILDEFALHKDQRLLYRIAKPVTQWGGQLEIISTHRGAGSVFNEIIRSIVEKENPMGWSHHKVTIQDAAAEGLVEKIAEKRGLKLDRAQWLADQRAGCIDEEQWLQEYCCVPADDAAAFLPYDLIAGCEYGAGVAWETALDDCKNPLYLGVDVGREHDLTVLWLI